MKMLAHSKTLVVAGIAAILSLPALADDYYPGPPPPPQAAHYFDKARVISSSPIYEQFNQPTRECWQEQTGRVTQPESRSAGGAILGAIVGGVVGNQIGRGGGRAAATAAGAAIGAVTGDRIDNSDNVTTTRPVVEERCRTIDHWSRRITGYNVVYRYRGNEYSTVMPYDPGRTVRVRVSISVDDR